VLAVISVAPLRGGGAAGYYVQGQGCEHELVQELTLTPGDEPALELSRSSGVGYYVNDQDVPGQWVGGGAAALGLKGRLGRDDGQVLQGLLDGQHLGERLVSPVWRRDESGARVDVRRAGFDVTLSAPKSVSTLMALGTPAQCAQVVQAHQVAVRDALAVLEPLTARAARAARGHHGDGQRVPRIATSGFVAAKFDHTTSRAQDPQLHTHVVVANLAQGADGKWSALDSRTLHREATTASYVYQHRLRAELTDRLGVAWTDVTRGTAEIDGIAKQVLRTFSTRRRQIEAALAEHAPATPTGVRGRAKHLAARVACLATRPIKKHLPASELRRSWAQRAEEVGFGPEEVARLLATVHDAPEADLRVIALGVLDAEGVTREQATFGQGTVLRELIGRLPAGAQVSTGELLRMAAELVTDDTVVPVLTPDGRAYTTRDMLSSERDALGLATRTDTHLAALGKATVAKAVVREGTAVGLRPDQQQVLYALLSSGRSVEVVAGPAGCGKTAALDVATTTWKAAGIAVAGTAVAALTAQGLEQASGAPSVSLARVLDEPDRHLPTRGVLLVDEAGMVGTRQLLHLLTLAADRQCKVILVGDPAQLPELEAGGMFARLTDEPSAIALDGHHRQQHGWEQDALSALRAGDVAAALDAYRQHDRLHTATDHNAVASDAVRHYLSARSQQPDAWQTVLLASSREDVRDLNDRVRQGLLDSGALGKQALCVETEDGPISYRVGDQVLVTRNDHRRGLLNGTAATVTEVDSTKLTLTTTRGQQVSVEQDWLVAGQLHHGYAMTLHKAQGRTVHTALVVGTSTMSVQAGYVGLSRGTHANHLFLAEPDVAELTRDCSSRVRYLRPDQRRPASTALCRDARQRLASQHAPERREGRGP
jgi:conjugative relaxase-like TrwC/TraI family protein